MNKIGFVIPTKDRPDDLKRLLRSFKNQTVLPKEVVIVDSSEKSVQWILDEFSDIKIRYLQCLPPSISRQCNLGIKSIDKSINLIAICGDDIEFEKDSIEEMYSFWKRATEDVGGVSFNLINHPPVFASYLKYSFLFSKFGLYSAKRGKVLKSGFHTMIGKVDGTIYTDWISTCASVWRREVLERYGFDEWFEGYSYLEDLDLSYSIRKKWKLAIVAGARFYHHHSLKGRGSGFQFGKREVINRLYFVRKHNELSTFFCVLALLGRVFVSLLLIFKERRPVYYIQRIFGNIKGIIESF